VTFSSYEIRIIGILPPEALLDFEDLVASVEPVETVVHGHIRDQAALRGLLARLEMLGVQVLEVRRLHEHPTPGSPALPDVPRITPRGSCLPPQPSVKPLTPPRTTARPRSWSRRLSTACTSRPRPVP
jgi:hypothetical protein